MFIFIFFPIHGNSGGSDSNSGSVGKEEKVKVKARKKGES